MKYVAAYLLAQLGGNESPSAADVKKILSSVGIDTDSKRLDALLSEVSGKSVEELIKSGSSKLASMPAGGAAAAGAAPAAAAAAPAGGKKEEKAPAKKEESEEEMGFGLFD
jgi:large subunit ribosomal protein LP2